VRPISDGNGEGTQTRVPTLLRVRWAPAVAKMSPELAAKRIQLLKEAVFVARRVAILCNPNNPVNKLELNEANRAGTVLGLTLLPVEARPCSAA
jgi:hypothetical protein